MRQESKCFLCASCGGSFIELSLDVALRLLGANPWPAYVVELAPGSKDPD